MAQPMTLADVEEYGQVEDIHADGFFLDDHGGPCVRLVFWTTKRDRFIETANIVMPRALAKGVDVSRYLLPDRVLAPSH